MRRNRYYFYNSFQKFCPLVFVWSDAWTALTGITVYYTVYRLVHHSDRKYTDREIMRIDQYYPWFCSYIQRHVSKRELLQCLRDKPWDTAISTWFWQKRQERVIFSSLIYKNGRDYCIWPEFYNGHREQELQPIFRFVLKAQTGLPYTRIDVLVHCHWIKMWHFRARPGRYFKGKVRIFDSDYERIARSIIRGSRKNLFSSTIWSAHRSSGWRATRISPCDPVFGPWFWYNR